MSREAAMSAGPSRWLLALPLAAFLLAAGGALACPICFSGRVSPLGQKIDAADAIILASPLSATGAFRVVRAIKGTFATGSLIIDANPAPDSLVALGAPMLLVRNKLSQQWTALGSLNDQDADWLRQFAAGGPHDGHGAAPRWPRTVDSTLNLSDEEWAERLALVAPKLEDRERLVAEIAYGEIARAPYRVLRGLRGARTPADLLSWLDDPTLAPRQPAYMLLLGIVGGPREADRIETRIATERAQHSAANLAALFAADLEIRGPSRVTYIEQTYLSDKSAKLPELEAALLALSVQGTADVTVPRSRVVGAYRVFIAARPRMAAFVIPDLSDWRAFEPAAELEAAMASGAIKDPASQFQVATYLQHAPAGTRLNEQGAGGDLPP